MDQAACAEEMRRFSRFYTRRIGVLHEGYNGSEFSLTEARIIYELAHLEVATASDLVKSLELNPGYLSRVLKSFEARELIRREAAPNDGRQQLISLTEAGQHHFAALNARSRTDMLRIVGDLTSRQQERLKIGRAHV